MFSPSSTRVITAAHATREHLPRASATAPRLLSVSHEPPCALTSPPHAGGLRIEEERAGTLARLRMVPRETPLLDITEELVLVQRSRRADLAPTC